MAQDPNAPTTPAVGDQGTGSGDGLDTTAQTAPEAPAPEADQAGISEPAPFSEAEITAAPPGDQDRMRGMVAKWTKSMQSVKAKERELADIVGRLERERVARESEPAEAPATPPAPAKTLEQEEQELYQGLDPNVANLLKKQAALIEQRVSQKFQPIAAGAAEARSTAALTAARARFPDFDQKVNIDFARQVLTRNPGMSLEEVYVLADYNNQKTEAARAKAEVAKYQMGEKRKAQTERPSGPSVDNLDFSWFEKMKPEERAKLSSSQIYELSNRRSR